MNFTGEPVLRKIMAASFESRERVGIGDHLVRLSAGIEALEDILEDLEQALALGSP